MDSNDVGFEMVGVSAGYGPRTVLTDFSLSVGRGELVAILGHNGAGKTTALRVASGLKTPKRGNILMRGAALDGLPANARARKGMGYVPEGVAGLFSTLTVEQNLAAVRVFDGSTEDNAWNEMDGHLNDLFGEVLIDRAKQVAGSMSGGQRQMLAIAMALRRRPTTLLLDEPSTGLAPFVVDRILQVVSKLVETTSTSVVLVEQNLASALQVSSRAVIVQSGQIVAEFDRDSFPEPTELWRYF